MEDEMPYPSEHSARINSPDKYIRIRRENDKFAPGIDAIWGIPAKGPVELQAIRFDASRYTAAQARAWCKAHDQKYISFEPASGNAEMNKAIRHKAGRG
jgi:hypothetical protein